MIYSFVLLFVRRLLVQSSPSSACAARHARCKLPKPTRRAGPHAFFTAKQQTQPAAAGVVRGPDPGRPWGVRGFNCGDTSVQYYAFLVCEPEIRESTLPSTQPL